MARAEQRSAGVRRVLCRLLIFAPLVAFSQQPLFSAQPHATAILQPRDAAAFAATVALRLKRRCRHLPDGYRLMPAYAAEGRSQASADVRPMCREEMPTMQPQPGHINDAAR